MTSQADVTPSGSEPDDRRDNDRRQQQIPVEHDRRQSERRSGNDRRATPRS